MRHITSPDPQSSHSIKLIDCRAGAWPLAAATAWSTYPAVSPRPQLDHVLVAPGLRLEEATTVQLGGSDHLAVQAHVHAAVQHDDL